MSLETCENGWLQTSMKELHSVVMILGGELRGDPAC